MSSAGIRFAATFCLAASALPSGVAPRLAAADLRKADDVIVYEDPRFYAAFPSAVRRPGGEVIVAFRRAPDRRALGEKGVSHTDPNSYLVLVRSTDEGRTWSREPELIHAHPLGGSQDPCMVQLADGSIVLTSYAWAQAPQAAARAPEALRHGGFVFLGGYVLRSEDGAKSWRGPFLPPALPGSPARDVFGDPLPSYNRGAPCQGRDGRLHWVVAGVPRTDSSRTECHLLTSIDGGRSWSYSCPVASDAKASFNEASLVETERGDLVAILRTEGLDDHGVIARSRDGGKSFEPWKDVGFRGHPHHLLRLAGGRILLVYGYRHAPFGIRARLLDAECREPSASPEIILREDGGNGDLGYPWAVELAGGRVLVVYYFHRGDGPRHIAGTILETAER